MYLMFTGVINSMHRYRVEMDVNEVLLAGADFHLIVSSILSCFCFTDTIHAKCHR